MLSWYHPLRWLLALIPGWSSPHPRRRRDTVRLTLEVLEERHVPAGTIPLFSAGNFLWTGTGALIEVDPSATGPVIVNPATAASTPAQAAALALNFVNPISQQQQWECGGLILQTMSGGKPLYIATVPITALYGGDLKVPISRPNNGAPEGFNTVGVYHTHVDNSNQSAIVAGAPLPNRFSPDDEEQARHNDLLSFLATPDGRFLEYVPIKPLQDRTPEQLMIFEQPDNWHTITLHRKLKTAKPDFTNPIPLVPPVEVGGFPGGGSNSGDSGSLNGGGGIFGL
jgi:hypothetical protein